MRSQYWTTENISASTKILGWPPQPPNLQPAPVTPPLQSHEDVPVSPPQYQVEVPQELKLMELDIPDDIPDFLNVPKEVMFDFDAWAQDVLSYQF